MGILPQWKSRNSFLMNVEFWKKKHGIKCPDVIIATPPCQGMSVANHKKGGMRKTEIL